MLSAEETAVDEEMAEEKLKSGHGSRPEVKAPKDKAPNRELPRRCPLPGNTIRPACQQQQLGCGKNHRDLCQGDLVTNTLAIFAKVT